MKLYHGTSEKFSDKILKEGLHPRGYRVGNWLGNNIPSHPKLVYLTNEFVKAEFYAYNTATVNNEQIGVVLSIDIDKLNKENLRADENYINHIERGHLPFLEFTACPFEDRYAQLDKSLNDPRWKESLEKVGMCAHINTISADSIEIENYVITKKSRYYLPGIEKNTNITSKSQMIKTMTCNCHIDNTKSQFGWIHPVSKLTVYDISFDGENFNLHFTK